MEDRKPIIKANVNQVYEQTSLNQHTVRLKIGGQATVFKGTKLKIRCPVKKFDRQYYFLGDPIDIVLIYVILQRRNSMGKGRPVDRQRGKKGAETKQCRGSERICHSKRILENPWYRIPRCRDLLLHG